MKINKTIRNSQATLTKVKRIAKLRDDEYDVMKECNDNHFMLELTAQFPVDSYEGTVNLDYVSLDWSNPFKKW